jgi:hypothetical protein
MSDGQALFEVMMAIEGDEFDFEYSRGKIETGKTFSEAAMQNLRDQMITYVGTRVMRRWEKTGEPPTALRVEMRVLVS